MLVVFLSRLKSVFVTFDKTEYLVNTKSPVYKTFNSFYSVMHASTETNIMGSAKEIEFLLTLGSKKFPETPIRSHQESFMQLRNTMGIQSSALHSFDISAQEYKRKSFIIGIDCETILHAAFTGRNTKQGELLNITYDLIGNNIVANDMAADMYIVLHSDNLVEISDSGCRVYD